MSWKSVWLATFKEAAEGVAEQGEEDKVGEFAGKRIGDAKEIGEEE